MSREQELWDAFEIWKKDNMDVWANSSYTFTLFKAGWDAAIEKAPKRAPVGERVYANTRPLPEGWDG